MGRILWGTPKSPSQIFSPERDAVNINKNTLNCVIDKQFGLQIMKFTSSEVTNVAMGFVYLRI